MSSLRQIVASRANGARSQGPKTPEGKKKSSQNAIRHGLLARCVVLKCESRKNFETLLDQFLELFGPVNALELALVEEMAACYWRQRRAWAVENRLLEDAVSKSLPGDEIAALAAAGTDLVATPSFTLISRYESRLNRMFYRAMSGLRHLRTMGLPNEPDPISEHPAGPVPELAAPDPPTPPAPQPESPSPHSTPRPQSAHPKPLFQHHSDFRRYLPRHPRRFARPGPPEPTPADVSPPPQNA